MYVCMYVCVCVCVCMYVCMYILFFNFVHCLQELLRRMWKLFFHDCEGYLDAWGKFLALYNREFRSSPADEIDKDRRVHSAAAMQEYCMRFRGEPARAAMEKNVTTFGNAIKSDKLPEPGLPLDRLSPLPLPPSHTHSLTHTHTRTYLILPLPNPPPRPHSL